MFPRGYLYPSWRTPVFQRCRNSVVFCVDCIQHGERKLVVSVYVKQVLKDTLRVEFIPASLAITFQTRFVILSMINDTYAMVTCEIKLF